MKYNGFFNIDMARSYLRRSVIRVEGTPIHVKEIEWQRNRAGDLVMKLFYNRLSEQRERVINIKSKRINLAPVPLGLMNYSLQGEENFHDCMVVSRIPSRMWKIGLSQNNMSLSPAPGKRGVNVSHADVLASRPLKALIEGECPSYKVSRAICENSSYLTTIAFNRHFAIQKDKKNLSLVYYKFPTRVGVCNERPKLLPEFSFLQEKLEEVLNV